MPCQRKLFFTGVFLLLAGFAYYLLFRDTSALYFHSLTALMGDRGGRLFRPDFIPWFDSLPSVLFLAGLFFIGMVFHSQDRRSALRVVVTFWGLATALEFAQGLAPNWLGLKHGLFGGHTLLPGTFDWTDIAASTITALSLATWAMWRWPARSTAGSSMGVAPSRRGAMPVLLAFGILSAIGSAEAKYTPIYMSYEELRTSVKADVNAQMEDVGKIYVQGNYLFVNSPNKGIHLFDNTDPTAPRFLTFIVIPGNLDLAIQDGFLYADSYIDLVVIDINDLAAIHEVRRFTEVFPYDPYQNAAGAYFRPSDIDESKGVVVGYYYPS